METTPNQTSGIENDLNKNKVMAALSYLGPFIVVSYLVANKNPFVKFHIKQGLVIIVIEAILWVITSALWSMLMIWNLINFAAIVLSIIGIINVIKGEEKELPLVGSYAKYFTF